MAVSSGASMRSRFSDTSFRFCPICGCKKHKTNKWKQRAEGRQVHELCTTCARAPTSCLEGMAAAAACCCRSVARCASAAAPHPAPPAAHAPAPWRAPPPAWCPAGTALSASWRPPPGAAAATACDTQGPEPPGAQCIQGRGDRVRGRRTGRAEGGREGLAGFVLQSAMWEAGRAGAPGGRRPRWSAACHPAARHPPCCPQPAPCRRPPCRLGGPCGTPRNQTSATPCPPRLRAAGGRQSSVFGMASGPRRSRQGRRACSSSSSSCRRRHSLRWWRRRRRLRRAAPVVPPTSGPKRAPTHPARRPCRQRPAWGPQTAWCCASQSQLGCRKPQRLRGQEDGMAGRQGG